MAKSGNTLLALVTGAAIGAVAGLLYAPESGEKTRKKLRSKAESARDEFESYARTTYDELADRAGIAKKSLEEKLESTINSASHKADDIIVTLERKLEQLREQNAKLQKESAVKATKANVEKNVKKVEKAIS